MINSYLSVEQEKRERQEINLLQEEARRNTVLYTAGNFDGVIGIDPDPEKWGEDSYRSGFLSGVTRHYDEKYQMSLNNEPF